ncbi:hypothetical protein Celaphus_00018978 [Cervus elaphus hippelaphus]|uniref:Uncharacterized protein n=1 Tax=Cervus elaphus hippelaphus TaxID=46360 RepID=A0A212C7Q0_CEREH|nr:hypothetical protein Celaphus_00018978 [Cervus elaphus hippelaphus]
MWSSLGIPTFLFLSFFSVGLAPDPGSTTNANDNYLPFGDEINGDSRTSNRFSEPPNSSRCAYEPGVSSSIFINSGWGGINYCVNIMYFLAAIESEFLGNLPYEYLLSRKKVSSTSGIPQYDTDEDAVIFNM